MCGRGGGEERGVRAGRGTTAVGCVREDSAGEGGERLGVTGHRGGRVREEGGKGGQSTRTLGFGVSRIRVSFFRTTFMNFNLP